MNTITQQLAEALRVVLARADEEHASLLELGRDDEDTAEEAEVCGEELDAARAALAAYDAASPDSPPAAGAHTAEPWATSTYAVATSGETGTSIVQGDDTIADCYGTDANARRIVACVNACAGIATEALEHDNVRTIIRRSLAGEN